MVQQYICQGWEVGVGGMLLISLWALSYASNHEMTQRCSKARNADTDILLMDEDYVTLNSFFILNMQLTKKQWSFLPVLGQVDHNKTFNSLNISAFLNIILLGAEECWDIGVGTSLLKRLKHILLSMESLHGIIPNDRFSITGTTEIRRITCQLIFHQGKSLTKYLITTIIVGMHFHSSERHGNMLVVSSN